MAYMERPLGCLSSKKQDFTPNGLCAGRQRACGSGGRSVSLLPKPLPAAVLERTPTPPVELLVGASFNSCYLSWRAREVLGVTALPHGNYELTAVAGIAEIDVSLYANPPNNFCLRKARACDLNPSMPLKLRSGIKRA